jgi:hypothetical protein
LVLASKDPKTSSAEHSGPTNSFDLSFEITIRDGEGNRNDSVSRVRYLGPKFVRFQLEERTELGVGPEGYWSQNAGEKTVDIDRREYKQSKQRVLDVLRTAKNFLALAEPDYLRIFALSAVATPPVNQPPGAAKRLLDLDWVTLDSPDFDLGADTFTPTAGNGSPTKGVSKARVYRAYLGMDKASHRVVEAMVVEVRDGSPLVASAIWISLESHIGKDGIAFPQVILIRRPDFRTTPWSFKKRPAEEFYLIEGTLRAALKPEDFLPL